MDSSQMQILPYISRCFPTTEQVNKILIRLLSTHDFRRPLGEQLFTTNRTCFGRYLVRFIGRLKICYFTSCNILGESMRFCHVASAEYDTEPVVA